MYITTCILNCAVINRLELPKFNPKITQKYNGIPAKYINFFQNSLTKIFMNI